MAMADLVVDVSKAQLKPKQTYLTLYATPRTLEHTSLPQRLPVCAIAILSHTPLNQQRDMLQPCGQ